MDKVYLVALKTYEVEEPFAPGTVYWHSVKAFHNKQDAVEYVDFMEAKHVKTFDGGMLFANNETGSKYYIKETYVRGTEDERETTR